MRRAPTAPALAVVAVVAATIFAALTIAVTTTTSLRPDARAFELADDLRSQSLNEAARIVTTFGLIAVVGPAVLVGAAVLLRRGARIRAAGLVTGAALTWIGVWIVKPVVNRPRPPASLVHTAGQGYPSAHAANSLGWIALAIALGVVIPARRGRIATVAVGVTVAGLVGLSRIYLRAHYISDVVAGEALASAIYAIAALGSLALRARTERSISGPPHRDSYGRPVSTQDSRRRHGSGRSGA